MQSGADNAGPTGPIALGRYSLLRVVGRGAMGEVWAATTPLVDGEIAVKVALQSDQSDPWAGRALDNEVATVAQLDHPGIVGVFDHGRVELVAHTASDGRLPVGAPYVVMEMLRGRSLHDFIGRLSWFEVQEVLRQLLDALGHCHARGVLHRDLKPGNVLLEAVRDDEETGLRLSLMDFGLARFFGQPAPREDTVAGTPAYMAPEQLQGSWRAQGPWTDLYSVGCLGWTLITGAPPFGRRRSYEAFLEDHLHLRPPPLDPMIGVPVAVEDWLLRLLAKSPVDRFRSASDARNALDALSSGLQPDALTFEPVAPPVRVDHAEPNTGEELSLGRLLSTANLGRKSSSGDVLDDDTRSEVLGLAPDLPSVWPGSGASYAGSAAPLPEHWAQSNARTAHPLAGSGLGVFGHRRPRLVGRTEERNRLWEVLREAETCGHPRVVVLRGAPGTGKSRLAAWLCETAYERAGVESLRATFTATEAADAGLVAMFRRQLRLDGLPADAIEAQIRQMLLSTDLEELELQALVDALAPAASDAQEPVRFSEPRERWVLFARLCSWLTSNGVGTDSKHGCPGLVWLDDAHHSSEALEFAAHVHARRDLGPLCVVLTVSDAEPAPDAAPGRGDLPGLEGIETLFVEPLDAADHRSLIDSLLRFEPQLGATLTARTAGNPRFAVTLVADWVGRGVIRVGPDGFLVSDEVLAEIPGDPSALWQRSLETALSEMPAEQRAVMELAATLGMRVDTGEWRAACARSRLRPQSSTLEDWVRGQLVERNRSGFVFAHPVVRTRLEAAARAAGRLVRHHRVCATVVELRAPSGPDSAGRVARHLMAAGDDRDALPYLLQAARGHAHSGEAERVLRALELWNASADRIGLPWTAPERKVVWTLHLDALWLVGSAEHAATTARLYDEAGERRDLRGVVALHRALRAYQAGEVAEAESELTRAADYASDDPHLTTRIGLEQVRLALERGHLDSARSLCALVLQSTQRTGDQQRLATLSWLTGRIEKQSGRLAAARAAFSHAVAGYERVRDRNGLARCTNELGEIARLEGDLPSARAHYVEALRMMVQLNSDNTDIVRVNLGLVLLIEGLPERARPILETALFAFRDAGRLALQATAQVALLSCAGAHAQWAEWDTRLLAASRDLRKSCFVDVDIAWLLENAAREAEQRGQTHRVDAALALAELQWRSLDRPADAERVKDWRATL
ncbi:MAG: hypothetical protein CL927_21120 [Deltaproteobacteria bacterium]|nr:hypothetical protein [Deltaproteobacteria bacterium]HCH64458.1 hypothetical protein [Deltaproteobacteria bacterium]